MAVVIVSGGTRGLGRAIIESFLPDKRFAISTFGQSRTPFIDNLLGDQATAKRFWFDIVDLSDRMAVNRYVRQVHDRFGPASILINNAGTALDGVLPLQMDGEVDRMVDVNLKGTIALTRACVREMLPQHWGRIITITSIVGKAGYRGLSVYSLTKAGLDGFTRSLARELGSRGITVNSVAPGFLETDMTHELTLQQRLQIVRRTPVGRLGRPADVLPVIHLLCSDEAAFITGQTIVVDGGITV